MMNKMCTQCEYVKPITDFSIDRIVKGGRKNQCKECKKAYGKEHYAKNKEAYIESTRKFRLKMNNNWCGVCFQGSTPTAPLLEDLDNNDKFKGLLCYPCKTALALFKKHIDILHNAIKYLGNE
ncbi:MAG: hypothetical protein ACHQVS_00655 [Candidatus Babeliales bacterium]